MDAWPKLPLSLGFLERYRLQARQLTRPSLVGGHLARQRGQSLEFREFMPYSLGDDVRHVDWRASARMPSLSPESYLIRKFVAEEQMRIAISIDTRESMLYPAGRPKLWVALWLAQALSWIALRSADVVILHRLFGGKEGSVEELRGSRGALDIRRILARFVQQPAAETPNFERLRPLLPPASAWLIVSDGYFPPAAARGLAGRIAAASDGLRWVILLDLDSWTFEAAQLGEGARLIEGPGSEAVRPTVEIEPGGLAEVEAAIARHKALCRQAVDRHAYDRWPWPDASGFDLADWFRTQFKHDVILRQLFMKNP